MMRCALILVTLALPFAAVSAGTPQAIRNGVPYTQTPVFPILQAHQVPYNLVGRLTYSDRAGNPHVCSGAIIQRRLVITAGHCLYSPGAKAFYTDVRFIPGYIPGP
jgi:V8-like Glu-specific endopeptidase